MDRKDFIKKGILGAALLTSSSSIAKTPEKVNEIEIVGLNHIPNPKSKIMANTILHKSKTRGYANHGWLESSHSFSFSSYYNKERMNFGALRVLNDDRIDPAMGFGTHPHDNMEIITIPLQGDLAHKDNMGNEEVIKHGDIQVMSAGTGIEHSEYNKNKDKEVTLLQIWVIPNKRNVQPRYDQITLDIKDRHNKFQQILSPDPNDDGVWIHQDAWFHLGTFDQMVENEYTIRKKGNGVYVFVIKGDFTINGQVLNQRDAFGIWDIDKIDIQSNSDGAEILLMDLPMNI